MKTHTDLKPAEEVKVSPDSQVSSGTRVQLPGKEIAPCEVRWYDNKFEIPIMIFRRESTADELSRMNEEIVRVNESWEDWKANLTFDEYKEYKTRYKKYKEPKLEKSFEQLKNGGLRWDVITETTDEATINFIVEQLTSEKIRTLRLEQFFSKEQIDTILNACKNPALKHIYFPTNALQTIKNKRQQITDKQALTLLDCFEDYNLKEINGLPGHKLANETVEKLAVVAAREGIYIRVNDCPFFNEVRRQIESTILFPKAEFKTSERFDYQSYNTDDIKRLKESIQKQYSRSANSEEKSSPPEFTLILDNDIQDLAWTTFLTDLLVSDVNIVKLEITGDWTNHATTIAILTALRVNKTVKKFKFEPAPYASRTHATPNVTNRAKERESKLVNVFKENKTFTHIELTADSFDGDTIIEALANHPALTYLELTDCKFNPHSAHCGKSLNTLLTNTKSIRDLRLTRLRHSDRSISELALGLKNNNTLDSLHIGRPTENQLIVLGTAFSHHDFLVTFNFLGGLVTLKGFYNFIELLKGSHILNNLNFNLPENNSEENKKYKKLFQNIIERNTIRPYAYAMFALSQAARQGHAVFKVGVYFDAILAFLKPKPGDAAPEKIIKCTDHLKLNMRKKTIDDFKKLLGTLHTTRHWFYPCSFWRSNSIADRIKMTLLQEQDHIVDKGPRQ